MAQYTQPALVQERPMLVRKSSSRSTSSTSTNSSSSSHSSSSTSPFATCPSYKAFQDVEQQCKDLMAVCQSTPAGTNEWLDEREALGEAMQRRETILERRRVYQIRASFEKAFPSLPCQICGKHETNLDSSTHRGNRVRVIWKTCCGSRLCRNCDHHANAAAAAAGNAGATAPSPQQQQRQDQQQQPQSQTIGNNSTSGSTNGSSVLGTSGLVSSHPCPICKFPLRDEETMAKLVLKAQEGYAWAQFRMSWWVAQENQDAKYSAEFMESAAAERPPPLNHHKHAMAMFNIALAMYTGANPFIPQDLVKAENLFLQAAQMGYPPAQFRYAVLCLEKHSTNSTIMNSITKNAQRRAIAQTSSAWFSKALQWLTLAASSYSAGQMIEAQSTIASLYMNSTGTLPIKPNMELARYWANLAATAKRKNRTGPRQDPGHNELAPAQFILAQTLVILSKQTHGGKLDIPGHCVIPQLVYWLRKASMSPIPTRTSRDADNMLMQIMNRCKEQCAHCHRKKAQGYNSTASSPTNGTANGTSTATTPISSMSMFYQPCPKCNVCYYCSSDCRIKHWKAGHSKDCIAMPALLPKAPTPPPVPAAVTTSTTANGGTSSASLNPTYVDMSSAPSLSSTPLVSIPESVQKELDESKPNGGAAAAEGGAAAGLGHAFANGMNLNESQLQQQQQEQPEKKRSVVTTLTSIGTSFSSISGEGWLDWLN